MNLPAVLIADPATARLEIAGLSLLERLLVTLHRAGCAPLTIVAQQQLPTFQRVVPLGIDYAIVDQTPALAQETLVADTSNLVPIDDARRTIEAGGRLILADGTELRFGVARRWAGSVAASIADRDTVPGSDGARRVDSAATLAAATRAFWKTLKSSGDSVLDRRLNRPIGRPLSKWLVGTRITPNQITIVAMLIGLAGAYSFGRGTYAAAVIGALLFQLAAIVDCVDGDVAFAAFKESTVGKWLDISADQVVHVALFAGIAAGVGRSGSDAPVLLLGASTVVGVVISFAIVVRGMLMPETRRNPTLAKLVDAMTNRDISYLILAMAILDRMELFLWCAAIGVHVFWIAALAVQTVSAARRSPLREPT